VGVLIAGGTGFVGLNIAEALLARSEEVVLFDRAPPPEEALAAFEALPGRLHVVPGDVLDPEAVREALALHGRPDAVVQAAAVTPDALREERQPATVLGVNLMGWTNLLAATHEAGDVRRVINLSSGSAYGDAAFDAPGPLDEARTAPDPVTLYAISKYASERIGRRLGALWHLDVRSLRLSSVFGPWERDTGVRDTLSPPMQATVAALRGEPAVLARPGERDWIYARDVAGAVLTLLDAPYPAHDLYNVGPGASWSVLDWCARLAEWRPGFVYRIAGEDEPPTVSLHGQRDRRPLAIGRLTGDLRYLPRYELDAAFDDFRAWLDRFPGYWAAPAASGP
jgi:UDP-glucose 4-epimerase